MTDERVQIVARLSADLIRRLDAYAAELSRQFSVAVSRNDAIKKLLEEGLKQQAKRKK